MDGENNIFCRSLRTHPAPWHAKVHNPGSNHRTDVIVDFHSREIAHMVQLQPGITGEQYRRSTQLIAQAPRLLSACIEFAALEDARGTLQPELVELIRDAGGPDLTERLGQTAPKVSAPAPAEHPVNQKDTVSQTTVKKQRRLQE